MTRVFHQGRLSAFIGVGFEDGSTSADVPFASIGANHVLRSYGQADMLSRGPSSGGYVLRAVRTVERDEATACGVHHRGGIQTAR